MLGEHIYLMWRSQHSFHESVFSFRHVSPRDWIQVVASVVQIHLGSLLPVSLTLNIYCLVCVCMSGGVCRGQRTYFGSEFSLPCWDPSAHPPCSFKVRYLFCFCSRLACMWASRYRLLSCCRCWDYPIGLYTGFWLSELYSGGFYPEPTPSTCFAYLLRPSC